MKIKKGDTIKVISGKDKGKQAKVIQALPKDAKVVVEGLNVVKRHRKPRREGEKGQRVEIAAPMAVAKVMLVCPHCSVATRIGFMVAADGKKMRRCKKCGKEF